MVHAQNFMYKQNPFCMKSDKPIELRIKDNKMSDENMAHYHKAYEIGFCSIGKCEIVLNGEVFVLCKNDVIFIEPDTVHELNSNNGLCYILNFTDEFLNKYFTKNAKDELFKCFMQKITHIKDFDGEAFIASLTKISDNSNDFIEFINLLRIISLNSVKNAVKYKNKTAEDIIEYISVNYKQIKKLEEISSRFFITKEYLCRLFKGNTGISVIKYINLKKTDEACRLLVSTNNTVDEISAQSGFNSSEYFCRTFKEITGTTPGGYRKIYG